MKKFKVTYKLKIDAVYPSTVDVEASTAWAATKEIMAEYKIPARFVVKIEEIKV